jgi:SAM-dependent methyltransferase
MKPLLLCCWLLLPWAFASAEVPVVGPGMNAYYQDADPEHWAEIFERSGREVFDRRFQVVAALGIEPGMRIADVGAGTGLYTMLFARAVGPAGRVYAVDISESFVAAIAARAKEYHVDNVVPVVNDQQGTTLPPDSVDLVFWRTPTTTSSIRGRCWRRSIRRWLPAACWRSSTFGGCPASAIRGSWGMCEPVVSR